MLLSFHNVWFLNDGSNTYLHPGKGSYSSNDLTIVDPSFLWDLHWSAHDDFCGSDHFPVIVEGNDPLKTDCKENWKYNKADWTVSKNLLKNNLTKEFENETDPVIFFLEIFYKYWYIYICIPKTYTTKELKKNPMVYKRLQTSD